jgi:hypothetical protein
MTVEVTVDELILRGVPPQQAHAVADALQARLAALAERPEAVIPSRAEAFRRLPAVEARADSPAELGEAVAGAVWGVLARGGA